MQKKLSKLLAFLLVALPPLTAAAPPGPGDLSDECISAGTGQTCYLANKSAVNQPLDTQTRGLALPNRLIESDMNMFVNPGQLLNYGTAYLEGWLGANNVWGGATVPLPGKQKLAIFIRRPQNLNSALGSAKSLFDTYKGDLTFLNGGGNTSYQGEFEGATFGIMDINKKGFGNADLMYGIGIGTLNLGLRLSYANVRNATDSLDSTTSRNLRFSTASHNIGAGLGVQWQNLGPGYLDFAISGDIPISKAEWNNVIGTASENLSVQNSGAYGMGFLTRYVMPFGQDKVIAAVNIDTYKNPFEIRGTSLTNASRSRDAQASALNISFDVAYHQMFQEGKLRIIYSTGFGSTASKYTMADNNTPATLNNSTEYSNVYMPLGVAAEHRTFETLKLRIGVRKNVLSFRKQSIKTVTTNLENNSTFYSDDELTVAMGLGWTPAEKVQLDFAMNANAFKLDTFFSAISARFHY